AGEVDPDAPRNDAGLRVTELPLGRAELRWLGYPRRSSPDGKPPELYDYATIAPEADWYTHPGFLTRYGDVRPLLGAADKTFVIGAPGGGPAPSSGAAELPPLAPGWKRTLLFYANGNEKGFDLHSPATYAVEPLPSARVDEGLGYPFEWNTRP